jgi:hypothetical protein
LQFNPDLLRALSNSRNPVKNFFFEPVPIVLQSMR